MPYNKTLEEGLKLFETLGLDYEQSLNCKHSETYNYNELKLFLTTLAEKIRESVIADADLIIRTRMIKHANTPVSKEWRSFQKKMQ